MYRLKGRESFGFSAENPSGKRGGGNAEDCEKRRPCIEVAPGETVVLCDAEGPGMITHMWFTGYVGHSFILRIYWDGADFPSVEAPLSAFFGCAYDENFKDRDGNYVVLNSAAMLVAPGRGYNSYWEMPFYKHCRITMENRSGQAQTLFYMISGWYGQLEPDNGYFHAVYRQEHPVQKGRSYVVLDHVEGAGCFAGIAFAAGSNGNNTCWVEGEIRMYLDGEQKPSLHYTGTEDYFCGSYGFGNDIILNRYQTFSGHYTGLYAILGDSTEMYNQQQRFLLYRWHMKDPVYFRKSFKMTMDNLGWTGPRYDDYTSVAFWYQNAPGKLPFILPSDKELIMR